MVTRDNWSFLKLLENSCQAYLAKLLLKRLNSELKPASVSLLAWWW